MGTCIGSMQYKKGGGDNDWGKDKGSTGSGRKRRRMDNRNRKDQKKKKHRGRRRAGERRGTRMRARMG